ncbi:hypothetical protein TWF173_009240 [Orbilia oligospora]|nr:hypothetical protein TWF173_009240 [Orbilia oligospora]
MHGIVDASENPHRFCSNSRSHHHSLRQLSAAGQASLQAERFDVGNRGGPRSIPRFQTSVQEIFVVSGVDRCYPRFHCFKGEHLKFGPSKWVNSWQVAKVSYSSNAVGIACSIGGRMELYINSLEFGSHAQNSRYHSQQARREMLLRPRIHLAYSH